MGSFATVTGGRFVVDIGDDCTVVHFAGDLDLDTRQHIADLVRVAIALARPIVADLSGVEFADSSGIASLLEVRRAARRAGLPFTVAGMTPGLRRVLELVGVSDWF